MTNHVTSSPSPIDLRRRIELIQDFKMPTATNVVTLTPDSQYIFAAGVYKPRVRCYDTSQLSMKFERCIDNEGNFKNFLGAIFYYHIWA